MAHTDAETTGVRDEWMTEANAALEEAKRFIPADETLSEAEASWLDFMAVRFGFTEEILYTTARRLRTLGTAEASALADRLVMLGETYEEIAC